MADAAHVQQFGCNGGPNQQWILADGRPGSLRLIARHSGKVLDIEGAAAAYGSPINQFTWHSGENQQFKLLEPSAAVAVEAAAQFARAKAAGAGGGPGTTDAIKPGSARPEARPEKGSEAHDPATRSNPAKAKAKAKPKAKPNNKDMSTPAAPPPEK
jgi:hypothetical protein